MKLEEMLIRAKSEIDMLRRENEVLRARVDTMDIMATLLHSVPMHRGSGLASPDIDYEMQKEIGRLALERKQQEEAAAFRPPPEAHAENRPQPRKSDPPARMAD